MKNQLEAIRLFVRVARTGSFSKVAREMGLAQSSVSRIVAELEKDLGAALLSRTTRAVVLNDSGRVYLTHVEQILAALDEASQSVRGTGELRGVLRVGTPFSLGLREVIPGLPAFLSAHPLLRVDLVMDDQRRDLVREGVDVALRIGRLPESSATSRRLATIPRILVAAPSYLERAGAPKAPADLAHHQIIVGPAGDATEAWSFARHGKKAAVRVRGRLSLNNNEAAVAATVAGLGILSTGALGSRRELAAGLLVTVLAGWTMGSADLHAVFPAGRASKPAARAFVDFLASRDL